MEDMIEIRFSDSGVPQVHKYEEHGIYFECGGPAYSVNVLDAKKNVIGYYPNVTYARYFKGIQDAQE